MKTTRLSMSLICLILLINTCLKADTRPNIFNVTKSKAMCLKNWKYHYDDQRDWSDSALSDSSWKPLKNKTMSHFDNDSSFWLRTWLEVEGSLPDEDSLVLILTCFPANYEIYWDGKLLEKNGKFIDTGEEKIPPVNIRSYSLNELMAASGKYLIAIKVSNYYRSELFQRLQVNFGYKKAFDAHIKERNYTQLFFAGAYFFAFLYCVPFFFNKKKRLTCLLWGISSLLFMLDVLVFLVFVNYEIHSVYFRQFDNLTSLLQYRLAYSFVFIFMIHLFELPGKKLLFFLIIPVVTGTFFYGKSLLVLYLTILGVLGVIKRRPGSLMITLSTFVNYLLLKVTLNWNWNFLLNFFIYHPLYELVFIFGIIVAIHKKITPEQQEGNTPPIPEEVTIQEDSKTGNDNGNGNEMEENTDIVKNFLSVRKNNQNEIIMIKDIVFFKSAGVYVEAHLKNERVEVLNKSLTSLNEILPNHFIRIHRSCIVDISQIQSYKHTGGSIYKVFTKNGKTLPLSRDKYKELHKILN